MSPSPSRAAAPSSVPLPEKDPRAAGAGQSGLHRLQRVFMMAGFACAVLGFLCVAFVVVSEPSGHRAAPWLVWPFMALLPAAMLLLIGSVLTGVALRRHN